MVRTTGRSSIVRYITCNILLIWLAHAMTEPRQNEAARFALAILMLIKAALLALILVLSLT
jgi:hypothetical protein